MFPLLTTIFYRLRLINERQFKFIQFIRNNDICFGDATKGLPLHSESCEVVYSSHMLEHLDGKEAKIFLNEVYRILRFDGIIRIAVPDLQRQIAKYNETGDADAFVAMTLMCVARPRTLARKILLLLAGTRHHQWMYDGNSLKKLLCRHGFINVEIMLAGKTNIPKSDPLDLYERSSESVYIEARKSVH